MILVIVDSRSHFPRENLTVSYLDFIAVCLLEKTLKVVKVKKLKSIKTFCKVVG